MTITRRESLDDLIARLEILRRYHAALDDDQAYTDEAGPLAKSIRELKDRIEGMLR